MSALVQVLGWTLVHAAWQAALLVLLAAGCGPFLPLGLRHRMHGLVLGLCLVLPGLTGWQFHRPVPLEARLVALADPVSGTVPRGPAGPASSAPWLPRLEAALQPHLAQLVMIWAVGASCMALRLGGGFALSLRWRRQGRTAPEAWQQRLEQLACAMGLGRKVRLLLGEWGDTPLAMGFWKPVVILPATLLTSLPPAYLEALLAHELAHVRRQDFLFNLLQGLLETLLFFHPAIWWLSARIRAEREELADDLAAQSLGDPRRLALALNALDDLQPSFQRSLFPAHAARGGHLLHRIERLLSPRPRVGAPWSLFSLLLVPGAALALQAALPAQTSIPAPAALVAQVDALAVKEGLDPQLLRSMAWVESGFYAKAKSPLGAMGLLQVMPETARAYGAKDLGDPAQVMAAGAKYLRFLLDHYQGDLTKAVAAYNCGEKALDEGRITEEAIHYRALVMDVLKAKAVQPEVPLAEGEVQGVIRRVGEDLMVHLRVSRRGPLKVDLQPGGQPGPGASIRIGEQGGDASSKAGSWEESQPNVRMKAPKTGPLVVRVEDEGSGLKGETQVNVDGSWASFSLQMAKPKP
ncbi:hypothetical protein GETHLI_25510 [Geothrix limicola]|uniref:Uncharacterized protein n=1 Tax=Geothrix limicola TaxID=2927978 RepID=A0ABQ5QGQ7_9BACT|nr:M56 family metallopeptidase [Geothrix limicola]GLH74049.1 hypothetical protein GETHLI_25510 [Geothrix limicola]